MGHRIAEAADLSGLASSTIRYYEDRGVVPPPARTSGGYRTYGERDLDRLAFVARTRALGLGVNDMVELVTVWEHDRCAPVADRLADKVAVRLADTRRRIAELTELADELQQAGAQLNGHPHDGPCVDGACICLADAAHDDGASTMSPPVASTQPDQVACTLEPSRLPARLADWEHLMDRAADRFPRPDGAVVRFEFDADVATALVTLAAAEHDCCGFFTFALHITATHLDLHVTGPPAAQEVITAMFTTTETRGD